jgi:hypothetical protein
VKAGMKLSLICAGLSHLSDDSADGKGGGLFRMPRISMARNTQQFLPDYALLLLTDELVMGRRTFEGLIRGQIDTTSTMPLMVKLLHDEGFIRLEDFDGALRDEQAVLELMIEENLQLMDSWMATMWKSVKSWQSYYEGLQLTLRPRTEKIRKDIAEGRPVGLNYSRAASVFIHHMGGRFQMVRYFAEEVLAPEGNDAEVLKERRDFLAEQIAYTVCHLLFSRKFSAAIHDWCDFSPHYLELIQREAYKSTDTRNARAMRTLFQVALPEFILWHPDRVLQALRNGRIVELRKRVREAVAEGREFDTQAATETLETVAAIEPGVSNIRVVTVSQAAASQFMPTVSSKPDGLAAILPGVQFSSHSIDAALADQKRLEPKEG